MPLVLAENENTESGIRYADHTGVSYQFPPMYRRLVLPGERFVYYRGRRSKTGTRIPQVYFGTGIIGSVVADPSDSSRLVCEVLDFQPFVEPVPFKLGKHGYLESGGSRKGYFQRGVRRITEAEFALIVARASSEPTLGFEREDIDATRGYAGAETARLVDDFAMERALEQMKVRFPYQTIARMPRNNPGFDILVGAEPSHTYVEVKGTQRSAPLFFITEGERRFSLENGDRYLFLSVFQINLETRVHRTFWHQGPIEEDFVLKPVQWAGTPKSWGSKENAG
jgi:hypothetical protein